MPINKNINYSRQRIGRKPGQRVIIDFIKKSTKSLKQKVRDFLAVSERGSYGKNVGAHWVTKDKKKNSK